ncbi:1-phosphofructokinase family hexose kinase [Jidongwangia harbinensis]|uniref:1-phosphofructokinase family hexose kinase n=1 Tax=Jidongwangia harbinensis TaxID=2878561 RepID=UPI001CD9320A|nr:hexose kinase [Jidongwangia harbinensis]MCA2211868.1 hexose kinase [Jidongwangia harbinensis]
MIVTVTPNPALDLTYTVDALVPHGTHRVTTVTERAGGKGLNVAAVLQALGEPVLATGLLGGGTGTRVAGLLAAAGVAEAFVPIRAETRRTVAVADRADATGFWEPGPCVTDTEWAAFVDRFRDLLGDADVVALCGSLPPGAPADGYATLIRLAAARQVPTVLDTSGDALRYGLAAGPDLVKPNAAELAALLGSADADPARLLDPGARATGNGRSARNDRPVEDDRLDRGARAAVVSHGPDGLVGLTAGGAWRARPPERLTGNPTGAGDACVAALARGLRDATAWPDLLADAVALSGAAVAAPVAGSFDPPTYRRLRGTVTVTAA